MPTVDPKGPQSHLNLKTNNSSFVDPSGPRLMLNIKFLMKRGFFEATGWKFEDYKYILYFDFGIFSLVSWPVP